MIGIYLQVAVLVGGLTLGLAILGAAPASYLSVPVYARWALAPVFGLAMAVAACTSAIWFVPGNIAGWVVLLPGLLVCAFWLWKRRAAMGLPSGTRSRVVDLAIIVVGVVALFGYPLGIQHSLGPGGYQVFDSSSYTGLEVELQTHTIPDKDWGPSWDLTGLGGLVYGHEGIQQIGFSATESVVDSLIGVEPVRTQAPFMIALILIGALGAYGAAAALFATSRFTPLMAAALYAGPVLFQLFVDGSESALIGLVFMLPIALVGWLALQRPFRRAHLVLLGVLGAGFHTGYPILVPGVGVGAVLLLMGAVVYRIRESRKVAVPDGSPGARVPVVAHAGGSARGDAGEAGDGGDAVDRGSDEPGRRSALTIVGQHLGGAAFVAVLAAVLALPPFLRNVRYWSALLGSNGYLDSLPKFDLPLPVMPGWLLGTRAFYFLPHTSDTSITQWILADVIPLALLVLVVYGAFRSRSMIPVVVLTILTAAVAFQVAHGGCSYCMQRSLLPMAILGATLVAAGVSRLSQATFPRARWLAGLVAVATLVVVEHANGVMAIYAARGAYFTPLVVHQMLDHLKGQPGPVLMEGWQNAYDAAGELPIALHSARDGTNVRLDLARETDDFSGLAYIGGPQPSGVTMEPSYKTVATRLASIQTDRQILERHGGIALERRVKPFDVTVTNGIVVNRVLMTEQKVFVNGSLGFQIAGPDRGPAALDVVIGDIKRAQVQKLGPKATVKRVPGGAVEVCIPTDPDGGPLRLIGLPVDPNLLVFAPSKWWANRPVVAGGAYLQSMRVISACDAG